MPVMLRVSIMKVKHSQRWLGGAMLLVVLLLVGLSASGCVSGLQPVGWSGGVVADGTLFLGSLEGRLVAVSTADGTLQWSEQMTVTSSSGILGCTTGTARVVLYGTPAVAGDLVYITGYTGKLYAFDKGSLQKRWVYPPEGYLAPLVGGPVVAQDIVYFGASDGRVYALDAATGVEAWEPFPTGDKIWSTPVVADGTVYVTCFDKRLYALDAATGEPRWVSDEAGGAIASTPLVYNDTVYFGAFDRYLYAVDAADGSLRWKSEIEAGNWFWATPVAYGNAVYAPCLDGKVYVFDAEDGHEIDAIDFEEPLSSSPVLVDGAIIIASEEGRVYSLKDNQKRELKNLGATVHAPLYASDGVVYIHTQEGEALYALEAATGTEKWPVKTLTKPETGG